MVTQEEVLQNCSIYGRVEIRKIRYLKTKMEFSVSKKSFWVGGLSFYKYNNRKKIRESQLSISGLSFIFSKMLLVHVLLLVSQFFLDEFSFRFVYKMIRIFQVTVYCVPTTYSTINDDLDLTIRSTSIAHRLFEVKSCNVLYIGRTFLKNKLGFIGFFAYPTRFLVKSPQTPCNNISKMANSTNLDFEMLFQVHQNWRIQT